MTAAPHPDDEPIPSRLVSVPVVPPGGFTADDLPRLEGTLDDRFELLDGDIVMMAPANHWHNTAMARLRTMLEAHAPDDTVIVTEQGVNLGASVPVPDLMAVSRSSVTARSYAFVPTDIHLAVEIVSPRTKTKDRKFRPVQYAEAGIPVFWRVENEDDAMVIHTFELSPGTGGYVAARVHRERLVTDHPFPIDTEIPPVTW